VAAEGVECWGGTNIGTVLVIGAGHGVGPGRGVPVPG